ncbi:hypothetical protein PJP14_29950, partial [Mycobacterium kansasii]
EDTKKSQIEISADTSSISHDILTSAMADIDVIIQKIGKKKRVDFGTCKRDRSFRRHRRWPMSVIPRLWREI